MCAGQNSDEKRKILFVIPSLSRAGAEMVIIDLIRGFDRNKFEVFLFTFSESLPLLERLNDCQLHHFNHTRKHKLDFSVVPAISKVIDEHKIEVVYTSLQIALLITWLGCRFSNNNPPIIHSLHKMVGRNKKDALLEKILYQWPMRMTKRIVCVCRKQEEFWIEAFPYLKGKTEVIYNGINPDYFKKDKKIGNEEGYRSSLNISEEALVIACVAGFRVEKNHENLVKAFARVAVGGQDAYLLLAGDGPEKENIQNLAKQCNIEEKVIFLGLLSDVRPLMADANLTIIASTAIETFSIAMLESMSMECPVISTDIGGHKEAIIPNVTGDIIANGSISEIENTLKKYISSKTQLDEMGLKAREMVLEQFTVEIMVRKTEMLATEIVEGI